ncbi:MAG: peptidylprolyl isomerase [Lentisphaerae bacterium]|nr:peptidylprolyl isomerase [Lentisphaerota bacterium]
MMFITKFNKAVRNKALWIFFAVIVVLSFVFWGTNFSGVQGTGNGAGDVVGELDGRKITPEEFRTAYFHAYLFMSMMLGKPLATGEKVDQALKQLAWKRLAALHEADKLELTATEAEVLAAIRSEPFFQTRDQFDRNRYDAFVSSYLSNLRASEAQFEEHIRQELVLSKARFVLALSDWVAPTDIRQTFHQLYDTFVVSYVLFARSEAERAIRVTEDDAQEYYESHTESFRIPETMRVKYVAFPVLSEFDPDRIDPAVVSNFYAENIEKFSEEDTNGVPVAIPFEDAEEEIRDRLAQEAAFDTATEKALTFEDLIAPDREGKALTFEQAAAATGLTVRVTAPFSLKEPAPGLNVPLDFNKAAFELRPTSDEYFSHPVRGGDTVYILAYDQRWDTRVPDYEEVKADAFAAARRQAADALLSDQAGRFRDAALQALPRGEAFEAVADRFGVEPTTTEPFTMSSGIENEMEYFYPLAKQLLRRDEGDVTDIIEVPEGVLVAHVDARAPADTSLYASMKKDVAEYIRKRYNEIAFNEWQEYLLARAKVNNLTPPKAVETEPDDNEPPIVE